ncbi:MAG: NIPSNAP family protein [Burkholderiaceae bacterium]|jgi:hypothetical protein
MIIDMRTYTMHPGRLKAYLDLYEKEGMAVQQGHLGKMIGYFTVEVGPQNQVVHMWGYQSMGEREAKRAAMESDPAWIAYRKKSAESGNIQSQKNKILKSTSFSPL